MGIERLGKKRTRRTRTWASICVGLFGDRGQTTDGATKAPADTTSDGDGSE
jgi:hypothetical protein